MKKRLLYFLPILSILMQGCGTTESLPPIESYSASEDISISESLPPIEINSEIESSEDIMEEKYTKSNYHTHTYRCNHAEGEDEQYVLAALNNGYDLLGFTDHVMLPYTLHENSVRGRYDEIEDYYSSIRNLKEQYADQIEILLGFECEWNTILADYYAHLIKNDLVDYLILGNHYLKYDVNTGNFTVCDYPDTSKQYVLQYLDSSIEALSSGLFKIFAHPDYFMSYYDDFDDEIKEKCRLLCEVAKENDVALEINQGCFINENENQYASYYQEPRLRYPYDKFWEIAASVGNKVVTGVDAHSPSAFNNTNARVKALALSNKYNIKITEDLHIESKTPKEVEKGHKITVINGSGSKVLEKYGVTVIKADKKDEYFSHWEVNGKKNTSYKEEFIYVQYEKEEKETTFKAIYKESITSYNYTFDKTFVSGENQFGDLVFTSNIAGIGSVEESRGARFNIADSSSNNTLIVKTNVPFNVNNFEISAAMGSGNDTTLTLSIGGIVVLDNIALSNVSQVFKGKCDNLTGEVVITMKATVKGKTSYLKSIRLY